MTFLLSENMGLLRPTYSTLLWRGFIYVEIREW